MPQRIQTLPIRSFSGIETKTNSVDQPPGSLRRADGLNTVPAGALSFGPRWRTAWSKGQLGENIADALAGATADRVHFVTVALGGTTFLIAWNLTANRPRGIWHVEGTGDPDFTSLGAAVITAPTGDVYRDHADGLDWYGSWVQDELWLGNGTDTNLVWASGALAVLGPTSRPVNPQDPSQAAFPPCLSFIVGSQGQVYGAGNAEQPLRVWAGQIPNKTFPLVRGLKTTDYSWVQLRPNATRITGLGSVGVDLVAHFDIGAPFILAGYDGGQGGWKLVELPTTGAAGAINPNCARDTKLATSYLGTDLELYRLETYKGSIVDRQFNGSKWRKADILTDPAAGVWNEAALKPISGSDYALIFDEKNGRTWLWATMAALTQFGGTLEQVADDFDSLFGMAFSPDGVLYVADYNAGTVSTVVDGVTTDIGLTFSNPVGLAFSAAGDLYVSENGNGRIAKVVLSGPTKTTFASGFAAPWGLAFDAAGNLLAADYGDNSVSSIAPGGAVTGLGLFFSNPAGLAFDATGNLYVAENGNGTVSRVTPGLVKTTFASDLDAPHFLAFDSAGNLYVSQFNGGVVTRINALAAQSNLNFVFSNPAGLAFGPDGLYIANNGDGTIDLVGAGPTQGVYCVDDRTHAITGPWRYPDFLSVCQLRDDNLNGCVVVGITRDGAFLWADLQAIGQNPTGAYTAALPAACAELSAAPTPNPGIPYVGVSADGQQFMQVLAGNALCMTDPWADWTAGSITATRFYNNSRVGLLELSDMDFGAVALQKEITALRTQWARNGIVYVGVFADTGGRLSGGYRGLYYPAPDQLAAIGGESSVVRVRVIVVSFNDYPAVLTGAGINWLPGVEA